MTATEQDVRALAYLAMRLRAETRGCGPWDEHGTHVVFAEWFKNMHLGVAVEEVLHHAQDPEAKTPAAIKRPFKPELPKPDNRWTPPKRDEECPHHPGQRAATCGGCAADRLAADDDTPPPRTWTPAADSTARQAALAAARAARTGTNDTKEHR